jgi:DNA-binding PadR family transcriptional regulator
MDIELSDRERIALRLIAKSKVSMYGLDLIKASRGALRRGMYLLILYDLEDKGLIISTRDDVAPTVIPRRLYQATDKGEEVALIPQSEAWEKQWKEIYG